MNNQQTRHIVLRPIGWLVAVLILLATSAQAQWNTAQKLCFPEAIGVPGNPGPPDWWSAPNAPFDDVRWRGASQRTWGGGVTPEAALRALTSLQGGVRYLYLSFEVRFDPSLDPNSDVLVITLASQTLEHRLIIFPIANQSAQTAANPASVDYATRTGGTSVWNTQAVPAWLQGGATGQTRVWVTVNGATNNTWVVQLRIPASTLGLASAFGFYSSLLITTPGGVLQHHFPRSAPPISEEFGAPDFANGIPPVNTWGEGQTGNDPTCNIGVSIAWNQIGTNNADPHTINISSPNTFFARPHNGTTGNIGIGEIKARFRLANWGAMPPGGVWRDISPAGGVASTKLIPANSDAPVGTIEFPFSVPAAEQAFYTANKHQCILVDLTSSTNLDFANDSVVRNMDFVPASRFERDAEISVAGLGDPPSGQAAHRLWVYIEEINMPASTLTTKLRGSFKALLGWFRSKENPDRPPTDVRARLAQTSDTSEDQTLNQMPTYRVHTYSETGKFVTIGGKRLPILSVIGSYGYFVSHDGELTGWSSELKGLERQAPNIYATSLPRDGLVKVTSTIEAEEPNAFIALGLLLVLLILLFLLFRLLRKAA
jgi:hypothetical protein